MATNNLAVPKELYALRKQKNDDDITLLLLEKIGATLPPLKKIGYSDFFFGNPTQAIRPFLRGFFATAAKAL